MLDKRVRAIFPGCTEFGWPTAADHGLAAAKLLERDRPGRMLNEMPNNRLRFFCNVHVQRITCCRKVKSELVARGRPPWPAARMTLPVRKLRLAVVTRNPLPSRSTRVTGSSLN